LVTRGGAACVQQSVAKPLGLGGSERAVEQQRLGPADQIVGCHHQLQPDLVHGEVLERELGQAGVLVVADLVLSLGARSLPALQDSDVLIPLVGDERLEAVSVVVGERQLGAGVRPLATADQPGALRQEDRSTWSVSSHTSRFSRSDPSWSSAATQALAGVWRIA
jgi:hypothetical protein